MIALFTGTHTNKVDRKGRVSVPAQFRATLSAQGFDGAILFPSFTHDCIEGCGAQFLEELAEKMDATADLFSEQEDDLASLVFAESRQLAFDPEGRIILPGDFMEHAGITDHACFVGKAKRFQIWQPDRRKAFMDDKRDRRRANPPTVKAPANQGGAAA